MEKKILLHKAFLAGIMLKGVDAVLEVLGGAALLMVSPQLLNRWVLSFLEHQLPESLASQVVHFAGRFSAGSQLFASFYLLSHGVMKLFIVAVLLKGKLWAYHAGIIFFFLFIVYQLYRYSYTHSLWLIVLSVFDAAVIYLTWEEYRRVKRIRA